MKSSVTLHKNVSYITLSVLGRFTVTLGGPIFEEMHIFEVKTGQYI